MDVCNGNGPNLRFHPMEGNQKTCYFLEKWTHLNDNLISKESLMEFASDFERVIIKNELESFNFNKKFTKSGWWPKKVCKLSQN
jgi:hypothetical protein